VDISRRLHINYCHFPSLSVRLSVRLSVTASSLQGVDGLGRFMAWSKAYNPRILIMVKKNFGDRSWTWPGGFEGFNPIYFQEYLWTFYKCVCVCVRENMCVCKRKWVCVCVCVKSAFCVFVFHIIMKLWECVCEKTFLRVCVFVFLNIMKLWECVCENMFLRVCVFVFHNIMKLWECVCEKNVFACLRICISQYYEMLRVCVWKKRFCVFAYLYFTLL
jgi:hypothetical protein